MANSSSDPRQVIQEIALRIVSNYQTRDHSGLSDFELAIRLCCSRVFGCWYLTKLVDPNPLDEKALTTITNLHQVLIFSGGETALDGLTKLFSANPRTEAVESLFQAGLTEAHLGAELYRRLEKKGLGNELLRLKAKRLGPDFPTPLFRHLGVNEIEVFPTYYRANSIYKLRRLSKEVGLECEGFRMVSKWPSYLTFSVLLFRLGVAYERIVSRFHWLRFGRSVIIAEFRKGQWLEGG